MDKRRGFALVALMLLGVSHGIAQEELPLGRCDRLPLVTARIGESNFQFLVDTGATSILNLKSFSSASAKDIQISSWQGTSTANAREVSITELALGNQRLKNLKLPAIDLSPIGNACGGRIDGILGIDLLERMGATLDLKKRIAKLGLQESQDPKAVYEEMDRAMHGCHEAFNGGDASQLEKCFEPDVILYSKGKGYRGRRQVMQYLQEHLLRYAPNLRFALKAHDYHLYGNAMWHSYEYTIHAAGQHMTGHGVAICRKTEGRWRMVNLHTSPVSDENSSPPQPSARR
ncbi:MAG: DUF4440 domain-containing protein [Acidobacteriales bacterium]|nr:DUF4440 domain-containing protein [Terriglobales bacterium]